LTAEAIDVQILHINPVIGEQLAFQWGLSYFLGSIVQCKIIWLPPFFSFLRGSDFWMFLKILIIIFILCSAVCAFYHSRLVCYIHSVIIIGITTIFFNIQQTEYFVWVLFPPVGIECIIASN
jgi:hypothetical protein